MVKKIPQLILILLTFNGNLIISSNNNLLPSNNLQNNNMSLIKQKNLSTDYENIHQNHENQAITNIPSNNNLFSLREPLSLIKTKDSSPDYPINLYDYFNPPQNKIVSSFPITNQPIKNPTPMNSNQLLYHPPQNQWTLCETTIVKQQDDEDNFICNESLNQQNFSNYNDIQNQMILLNSVKFQQYQSIGYNQQQGYIQHHYSDLPSNIADYSQQNNILYKDIIYQDKYDNNPYKYIIKDMNDNIQKLQVLDYNQINFFKREKERTISTKVNMTNYQALPRLKSAGNISPYPIEVVYNDQEIINKGLFKPYSAQEYAFKTVSKFDDFITKNKNVNIFKFNESFNEYIHSVVTLNEKNFMKYTIMNNINLFIFKYSTFEAFIVTMNEITNYDNYEEKNIYCLKNQNEETIINGSECLNKQSFLNQLEELKEQQFSIQMKNKEIQQCYKKKIIKKKIKKDKNKVKTFNVKKFIKYREKQQNKKKLRDENLNLFKINKNIIKDIGLKIKQYSDELNNILDKEKSFSKQKFMIEEQKNTILLSNIDAISFEKIIKNKQVEFIDEIIEKVLKYSKASCFNNSNSIKTKTIDEQFEMIKFIDSNTIIKRNFFLSQEYLKTIHSLIKKISTKIVKNEKLNNTKYNPKQFINDIGSQNFIKFCSLIYKLENNLTKHSKQLPQQLNETIETTKPMEFINTTNNLQQHKKSPEEIQIENKNLTKKLIYKNTISQDILHRITSFYEKISDDIKLNKAFNDLLYAIEKKNYNIMAIEKDLSSFNNYLLENKIFIEDPNIFNLINNLKKFSPKKVDYQKSLKNLIQKFNNIIETNYDCKIKNFLMDKLIKLLKNNFQLTMENIYPYYYLSQLVVMEKSLLENLKKISFRQKKISIILEFLLYGLVYLNKYDDKPIYALKTELLEILRNENFFASDFIKYFNIDQSNKDIFMAFFLRKALIHLIN